MLNKRCPFRGILFPPSTVMVPPRSNSPDFFSPPQHPCCHNYPEHQTHPFYSRPADTSGGIPRGSITLIYVHTLTPIFQLTPLSMTYRLPYRERSRQPPVRQRRFPTAQACLVRHLRPYLSPNRGKVRLPGDSFHFVQPFPATLHTAPPRSKRTTPIPYNPATFPTPAPVASDTVAHNQASMAFPLKVRSGGGSRGSNMPSTDRLFYREVWA